ncbi:hypothetical protein [Actinoplanes sp. TFC3]|uniref:hypothetical protein n=1 Tax=Actinoplanes sp. TFC3 TaxID=1710355 RepID=UPI0013795B5E|nr:hypothetical protein [Actinoplanes sp. TFC3]
MSRTTARRPTIVALAVACLLGGCSSPDNDTTSGSPQIATLQSTPPRPSPPVTARTGAR